MKRWNGWGDTHTDYPLHASAQEFLNAQVGRGVPIEDAKYEQVLASTPASRLPDHPLISRAPEDRLAHARGQSLPDWVELRSGQIQTFPEGVAYPLNNQEVRSLIDFAKQGGFCLIPYGGGTSVVGHINPLPETPPAITLDMTRMDNLIDLNPTDHLATFQTGVDGPQLENQLREHGYTLGHFPQSFELSTLGGWISARSTGQQSYYYGRIEDLFAGGSVETPSGVLELPIIPSSAAGPDLRQVLLGSEGRLGIITSATVRIRRLPEIENFYGVFFPDWQTGIAALKTIVQEKLSLSMLRLSNATETQTTLILSGKDKLVSWADRGLTLVGYGAERCLLIFGVTGSKSSTRTALHRLQAVCREHHGLPKITLIGKMWRKSRFLTPYLRNTLWERGYALDTLETAMRWSKLEVAASAVQTAIRYGLREWDERVLVFAHISHVYRDGASLYITFLFRRASSPAHTLERWQKLKSAASRLIIDLGGTISHQHGIGLDHAVYLGEEKGEQGMRLLHGQLKSLDPMEIMNPGKLFRGNTLTIED